jgi:hypothetical protein
MELGSLLVLIALSYDKLKTNSDIFARIVNGVLNMLPSFLNDLKCNYKLSNAIICMYLYL